MSVADTTAAGTTEVCVALGSNLGDKAGKLQEAIRRLAAFGEVLAVSHFYRTEPVGFAAQDWFLNAAILLRTALEPRAMLEAALRIEQEMGRVRTQKNGPRLIDIDLLLWGDRVVDEPGLSLPHPRLHERLFVMAPLAEIAPAMRHPLLGLTMAALRDAVAHQGGVELWLAAPDTAPGSASDMS
jgi:2-amino-4-hydroxy-6-hydroxymethyldihydropteridine diphosphokinase